MQGDGVCDPQIYILTSFLWKQLRTNEEKYSYKLTFETKIIQKIEMPTISSIS